MILLWPRRKEGQRWSPLKTPVINLAPHLLAIPLSLAMHSRCSSPSTFSTLSVSPSLSRIPSPTPSSDFSPCISKREYLMAQIRQKDTIIESLLKQVGHGLIYSSHSFMTYKLTNSL